jgi:hypothetical protein
MAPVWNILFYFYRAVHVSGRVVEIRSEYVDPSRGWMWESGWHKGLQVTLERAAVGAEFRQPFPRAVVNTALVRATSAHARAILPRALVRAA